MLPFMLGMVISIVGSGQTVGKTGYYWPFLVIAPIFLSIGSGLLYTLSTSTSLAKIAGFQILSAIGVGLGMQTSLFAIQVEFKDAPRLLGQATSLATFFQFLGGTLGLGIAEPVFASSLGTHLLRYAPSAPVSIVRQSPTAIYTDLPKELIPGVVRAYAESLRMVFVLGVPVAGLAMVAAMFISRLRIEKSARPGAKAEEKAEADPEKGVERVEGTE